MRISPLDIRKQSFKKVLRGADPDEVRMFLEVVASEYEKILQENAMVSEKLRYQEERLAEYRELEKSMRNSLVTADRIATESREASERDAGRVIQDARSRGDRILEDSRERLQKLVHEIEALRSKKDIYVRRFRSMLEGQMEILEEHGATLDDIDAVENSAHNVISSFGGIPNSSRPSDDVDVISFLPDTRERSETSPDDPGGEYSDSDPEAPSDTESDLASDYEESPREGSLPEVVAESMTRSIGPAVSDPDIPEKVTSLDGGIPATAALQGVGKFFKRADSAFSLEETDPESSAADGNGGSEDQATADGEADGFFRVEEKREGFFEFTAKDKDSSNG